MDLIFDIVETKKETLEDPNANYLWVDRKKQMVHYIRNNYKTFKTYGQRVSRIDNERFLVACKKCQRIRPIPRSHSAFQLNYIFFRERNRIPNECAKVKS